MDHFNVDDYIREKMLAKNKKIKTHWEKADGKFFLEAIMHAARKPEILKGFLDELLSTDERQRLTTRIKAAQYLFAGLPYRAITGMTGLGSANIAKISKRFTNGRYGLYEVLSDLKALERLKEAEPHKYRFSKSPSP